MPTTEKAAAAETPEAPGTETPEATGTETPEAAGTAADEVGGVDCQDGHLPNGGAECDGGPAANSTGNGAETNG